MLQLSHVPLKNDSLTNSGKMENYSITHIRQENMLVKCIERHDSAPTCSSSFSLFTAFQLIKLYAITCIRLIFRNQNGVKFATLN